MRLSLPLALLVGLTVGPPASGSVPAPTPRPNVLLIITDQQFADAMSCRMGKQFIHTPTMDGLATQGMLFTRAYASNPLCMPLRNSLFTGRYPHETRVTKNAQPQGGLDPREFPCMGTYFRKAGYETAYCGKWHLCFNRADSGTHGFEILRGGKSQGGPDVQAADRAAQFLARKGSCKNKLAEFALRFAPDSVATTERIRRRSSATSRIRDGRGGRRWREDEMRECEVILVRALSTTSRSCSWRAF